MSILIFVGFLPDFAVISHWPRAPTRCFTFPSVSDYQEDTSAVLFDWMAVALRLQASFVKVCGREIVYSMLLSLTIGFLLTAVLNMPR